MEIKQYINKKRDKNIELLKKDAKQWTRTGWENKISYEITWLGVPIIQLPNDMILMQELIFEIKPDFIIECGIAHGGSLIYYASLLELLGKGKIIGIDIEIRPHNKKMIESHPMIKRIKLIEGSSISQDTIEKIKNEIIPNSKVIVCLDSNHNKSHVLKELDLYKNFISSGGYIVVFDTIMPELLGLQGAQDDWDKNNPLEAINEFLTINKNFEIDETYHKLFVSYCKNGFLRKKSE
ncbi:MAG: cephalosporin hydroxylase [Candidatus Lokiarchaeota archaeon]|nr:cephalosporin hydroxylase [Candidatus Lokiarchaeota archaeon]